MSTPRTLVIRDFGTDETLAFHLQEMLAWITAKPEGKALGWRVDEEFGRVRVTLTDEDATP